MTPGIDLPPPAPTFTPDTRPIQVSWTGPRPQWTPDQWTDLLGPRLLDRAPLIKGGKPRCMIHHPGSWYPASPTSDSTHNMAQFYTLPEETRAAIQARVLYAWKYGPNAKNFTIGITCHLSMVNPFVQQGMARYWDASKFNEFAAMWNGVVWPWHELLGAGSRPGPGLRDWGMEGGNTDQSWHTPPGPGGWATALPFGNFLRTQGIRPMTEAIPVKDGAVDLVKASQMACWCNPAFADGNIAGQSVAGCPEAHLLLVGQWVNGVLTPSATVEQIKGWLKRGFIVGGDHVHDDLIREAMA